MKLALICTALMILATSCRSPEWRVASEKTERAPGKNRSGEREHHSHPVPIVVVALPMGLVNIESLVQKANVLLSKKYKEFSEIQPLVPLVEFYPTERSRSIIMFYSRHIGEPFWKVTFNAKGEIIECKTATLTEDIAGTSSPSEEKGK